MLSLEFPSDGDIKRPGQLYWTSAAIWDKLGLSRSLLAWQISSAEIVDLIIEHAFVVFPNLEGVVIAGYSAGGQFVTRYSGTNSDRRIRYLVGAPSSYAYPTAERFVDGSGFVVPDSSACPTYNNWRYGMGNLSSVAYINSVGAQTYSQNLGDANVAYMVGSLDNDPLNPSMDKSCDANMQGAERLTRARRFFAYLGHRYGPSVYDHQTLTIVDGAAHESAKVFGSPAAREVFLQDF